MAMSMAQNIRLISFLYFVPLEMLLKPATIWQGGSFNNWNWFAACKITLD